MPPISSFERATPQSQGVDPSGIADFVRAANDRGHGLHSLMVVRHGKVVAEGWWEPYSASQEHMMFSVSKTFTATAIGIAQDEGLVSVDDPILSYFPSYATPEVRENVRDVKVRDLLAMATGHDVDTMEIMRAQPTEDWVKVFLDTPIVFPPGKSFLYNSGASFVLSALISSRTGKSVLEYLTPRLFEPLGMRVPPWAANRRGIPYGASGLRITTEDVAKIGQLYLQKGMWNGRQLLSEDWVAEASARQVSNGTDPNDDWATGYGFQIWRSRHNSFRFDGRYGQFSFVLPEQDAVVAITSGARDSRGTTSTLWEFMLPAFHDAPLDDDSSARGRLVELLGSQSVPIFDFLPTVREPIGSLAGRTFALPFNTLHATSVRLDWEDDVTRLSVSTSDGHAESVDAGRLEWLPGRTGLWPYEEMESAETLSRAGAVDDSTFEVVQQLIETPFRRTWHFQVDHDGELTVTVGLDNGFWVERTEVLRATPHNEQEPQ